VFKNWIHTARYVYNRALDSFKKKRDKCNFHLLRNKFVTHKVQGRNNPLIHDWELETPKDIRAGAIKDMVQAYETGFSSVKSGLITHFDISYRKKRINTTRLSFLKQLLKEKRDLSCTPDTS